MKSQFCFILISAAFLSGCGKEDEVKRYSAVVEIECRNAGLGTGQVADYCGCLFMHTENGVFNANLREATDVAIRKAGPSATPAQIVGLLPGKARDQILEVEAQSNHKCQHLRPK